MQTENLSNEELIEKVKTHNNEVRRVAIAEIVAKVDEDLAQVAKDTANKISRLNAKREVLMEAMNNGISDLELERLTNGY